MNRKNIAKDLFLSGYSCSQAVAAAFADIAGLTREQMLKLSVSFGGGFLHSKNLCGALSGLGMALGGIFGEADSDAKKRFLQRFEVVLKNFEEVYGNVNCRELIESAKKAEKDFSSATEEEYSAKPCLVYVLYCVELVEKELKDALKK